MAQKKAKKRKLKYNTVDIFSVKGRRRGKHHGLVEGVLLDLEVLPSGQAASLRLCAGHGLIEIKLPGSFFRRYVLCGTICMHGDSSAHIQEN
jgi:hypothetical protein